MPAKATKRAATPAPIEAPSETPRADPTLDPEEIARLAHSYWEERGGQGGSAEDDWLRAERELKAMRAAEG